jgi:hypothetical protein
MVNKIEDKVKELIIKYGSSIVIFNKSSYYVGNNIPKKKLDNAIASYASVLNSKDVLALLDTSFFGSARIGFIIAKRGIWYRNVFENVKRYFLYTKLYDVMITKSIFGDALILYCANDTDFEDILNTENPLTKPNFYDSICSILFQPYSENIIDGVNPQIMKEFLLELINFINYLKDN